MHQHLTTCTFCFSSLPVVLSSSCLLLFCLDGNFLAIGSHDNYIYVYAVAENGRKYSRVGKCSVSTCIYIPSLILVYF